MDNLLSGTEFLRTRRIFSNWYILSSDKLNLEDSDMIALQQVKKRRGTRQYRGKR